MLKEEYEREINEKKKREEEEKKYDKIYADLELSYQEYYNKRRLYDI